MGIRFLPPDINQSKNHFFPENGSIRVPLCQIQGLSFKTVKRWETGKPYRSMRDFYLSVNPSTDEMDKLIRAGAFDAFGQSRTELFWQFRELAQWQSVAGQGLLLQGNEKPALPDITLKEPTQLDRLKAEQELLGFPVSDHPLAMFPGIHWDSYCPIASLKDNHGERVVIAGMIIEDRIHRQENGGLMKFISL